MFVDLQGKVALVTGAGRGIGRAIADVLTANQARVVYSDIDYDAARFAGLQKQGNLAMRLDVSNPEEMERGIADTLQALGRLDILVNNAGINTLQHRVN